MDLWNVSCNKKAIFILPYFGKLPNYFQLYLQSCKYNKNFDWLIITDDFTQYEYPKNVKVVIQSFEDIKELIQSKFDFVISLDKSYKLCDYRPAFGYIFQEYITAYDFWGHVDQDCIWGDLDKYVTWDLLDKYDKLYMLGHLSIYRNTLENNRMFMRPVNDVCYYKNVYSSQDSFGFDERILKNTIHDIYSFYKIPVYEDSYRADISPRFSIIRLDHYNEKNDSFRSDLPYFKYFEWDKGVLWEVAYTFFLRKRVKECSYLHFHGDRLMKCKKNDLNDHFYIFRNQFLKYEKQTMFFILIRYFDYLYALALDLMPLKIRISGIKMKKIMKKQVIYLRKMLNNNYI